MVNTSSAISFQFPFSAKSLICDIVKFNIVHIISNMESY